MGVYLLVLVGVTTAVTDAAAACAAWPVCGNGWATPESTIGWLAVGHRVAAVIIGLLAVVTLGVGVYEQVERRVLTAVAVGSILYPIQAAVGAVVAIQGPELTLSIIHLVGGLSIFLTLSIALAWSLETETGDPTETQATTTKPEPDPDLPPASEHDPDLPTDPRKRLIATVRAYIRLTKPRLMWLLCLVASAGMTLGATTSARLTPTIILATLGGGVLSIGASGTFNHVLERDVDRRMQRTSDRPLATDLVPVWNAIAFGITLTVASIALFAWINTLAAILGGIAIVFYSVVYTLLLKPNTVQNTVIGGAAGALPALIGWTAVTGNIGFGGLALAIVIFMWTPAHFYNLALAYKEDYERGGFPMMPVVRGETETRKHVIWWLALTLVAAAGLATMEALGIVYALASVIFGTVFLYFAIKLHYEQTETAAFHTFHASNAYLGSVLIAIVFDTLVI
ncbi:heme o synthase [Haloquadratum walsbyi]|jgi:protoheme IX farnesyltransferase|nr:heme o synthase [Haloquadratum walsbyi]